MVSKKKPKTEVTGELGSRFLQIYTQLNPELLNRVVALVIIGWTTKPHRVGLSAPYFRGYR